MKQPKRAIALGFFDGVHLGHSKLLERTLDIAKNNNLTAAVYTFDRHPSSLLTGKTVPLINTTQDREYLIRQKYNISDIIIDTFDNDLMSIPWQSFIRDILVGKYNAHYLIAGYDYKFGYKGQGNAEILMAESKALGLGCEIVEKVMLNDVAVSSTYIRGLIAEGDMNRASLYLNHPHILSGRVIQGKQLGRTLGIPTVNLPLPPNIQQPALGVYATRVHIDGIDVPYMGVTNVGTRPTVTSDSTILVETYIIDFEGDLYGKDIRLEFLDYIRPEINFSDLTELKNQVLTDIELVRTSY